MKVEGNKIIWNNGKIENGELIITEGSTWRWPNLITKRFDAILKEGSGDERYDTPELQTYGTITEEEYKEIYEFLETFV